MERTTTHMLALLKAAGNSEQCHPNLLPCKIIHNGPVDACDTYWKPEHGTGTAHVIFEEDIAILMLSLADSQQTAYFRGRKLHGRVIKLPESHAGSVVRVTDEPRKETPTQLRHLPLENDEEMDDDDQHSKTAEELATFDQITVWGHERTPAAAEDAYVMAVEEWIGLAEVVRKHCLNGDTMLICLDSFDVIFSVKRQAAIIDEGSTLNVLTMDAKNWVYVNTKIYFNFNAFTSLHVPIFEGSAFLLPS